MDHFKVVENYKETIKKALGKEWDDMEDLCHIQIAMNELSTEINEFFIARYYYENDHELPLKPKEG